MSESALEFAAIAQFEKMAKANQKLRGKVARLEKLVEEAFREGFCAGVIAGHPMHSPSSYSEAWENSESKEEVSYEIDSGKPSMATKEDFNAAKKAFDKAKRVEYPPGVFFGLLKKISMQQRKHSIKPSEVSDE
jgi:hypothetical protein